MRIKDQMTFQYIYPKYKGLILETLELYKKIYGFDYPYNEIRLDLMTKLMGTGISEAIHVLHYLHKSINLIGDVCEFGVAQGATSAFMANEIKNTDKNIWLFDSFKGLSKPTEKDILINDMFKLGSMDAYEGSMKCDVELVLERLEEIHYPLHRAKIVTGFIEETIKEKKLPKNVCFAYIDFDLYEPISVTLNFLNEILSVGGHIIIDDYGYFSSGVKTAVDEFIADKINYRYEKLSGFCILNKVHI